MSDEVETLDVLVIGQEAVAQPEWAAVLGDRFNVSHAPDTRRAIQHLERSACAVVVANASGSTDASVALLQAVAVRWPHVIRMMTAPCEDASAAVRAINDAGVFAFLPLPLDLTATARLFERATESYRGQRAQVETIAELRAALSRMEGQMAQVEVEAVASRAQIDADTELWDRHHLVERLEDEANRLARYGIPFGVLMVEVDPAVEGMERAAADLLRDFVRRVDVCARFEPSTFVILAPSTDGPGMSRLPERVRDAFSAAALPDAPAGTEPSIKLTQIAVTEAPASPGEVLARLQEARKNRHG